MSTNNKTMRTASEIIGAVTEAYILNLDLDNLPSLSEIESELLNETTEQIVLENQTRPKGAKLTVPQALTEYQIVRILTFIYPIVRINCGADDSNNCLLGMYQEHGENEGIYVDCEEKIMNDAQELNKTSTNLNLKSLVEKIRFAVPIVDRTTEPDKIAVNNGIFNFKTKELEPFNPGYVFLAKSKVDYNPMAHNVVLHNDDDGTDWDVESWVQSLSDDPEVVELLWQVLAATVRPFVSWNKVALFYSELGNNGKGTFCELVRNLSGRGTYISIPISNFGQRFALENLVGKNTIICDENDVGSFLDKASNFKAIATNDVVSIDRKFKAPIDYRFCGFQIQCINEMLRFKDKSNSLYRRLLVIPFTKCFTGCERTYIKKDYLARKEVLEYVLFKVLNMDFYALSEPFACKNALAEYKVYNDPVRQCLEEVLEQTVWDLLPFTFLYDCYKSWFKKNMPNGLVEGRNTFINAVIRYIDERSDWYCPGKNTSIHTGKLMDTPEHLIAEYDLVEWKNPTYTGLDLDKVCSPNLKVNYTGIRRI